MRKNSNKSIGVFDSGVGGLTVMRQIIEALPEESLIYYGDTARVPYGGKSQDTIVRYAIESAIFLMEQDIKMLVVACNTVSAYAINKLKQIFNIPIIGVIEPGADKAVAVTRNKQIAVLGTKGTILSGRYQEEIEKRLPQASVHSIACPLFVPFIEEHFLSHEATKLVVKEYLSKLKQTKVDTVLLGCTHYPLIKTLIAEELGNAFQIVDSAQTCAETVKRLIREYGIENEEPPVRRYYVSDDPEKFRIMGEKFLGMPLDQVQVHKQW